MAIISTARSSHQRPNPHIHVGRPKPRACDDSEFHNINKAIIALNEAKTTSDHTKMMVGLTEAFRLIRNIYNENK